jgi:hypothetical protein
LPAGHTFHMSFIPFCVDVKMILLFHAVQKESFPLTVHENSALHDQNDDSFDSAFWESSQGVRRVVIIYRSESTKSHASSTTSTYAKGRSYGQADIAYISILQQSANATWYKVLYRLLVAC